MRETGLIVVPVDFSPGSEAAAFYAGRLATRLGGRLRLVHVVGALDQAAAGVPPGVWVDLTAALQDAEARARDELERVAARLVGSAEGAGRAAPETAVVTTGDSTASAIIDAAREAGAELIVMGTHGRGGVRRMVLGSVAEQVVRAAHCPVLTVREAPGTAGAWAPARAEEGGER